MMAHVTPRSSRPIRCGTNSKGERPAQPLSPLKGKTDPASNEFDNELLWDETMQNSFEHASFSNKVVGWHAPSGVGGGKATYPLRLSHNNYLPEPLIIALNVFNNILTSSIIDQLSIY